MRSTMAVERQTKEHERPKAEEGLSLEELEAQVGELLPDRLELRCGRTCRRRRRRIGASCLFLTARC